MSSLTFHEYVDSMLCPNLYVAQGNCNFEFHQYRHYVYVTFQLSLLFTMYLDFFVFYMILTLSQQANTEFAVFIG